MQIWEIILIALGLAMDCFAVALGIGTCDLHKTTRKVLRLSFHFGLFQGLMAFIGWFAGSRIVHLISALDHWIAFGLLFIIGARMIKESFSSEPEDDCRDSTRGGSLVLLSIATSIDALAVGLSLAFIDGSILLDSLVIGITSFALAVAGYSLGSRLGTRFGKRMEMIGGLILIGIGLKVLLSHLL